MAGDRLAAATPWLTDTAATAPAPAAAPEDSNAAPWAANLAGSAATALPALLPEIKSPGGVEPFQVLKNFSGKHGGTLLKGGGALGALGILAGAAGELSNPNESKLSNIAGATGSAVGGFGGAAGGAALGGALTLGNPLGVLAGGAIGAMTGAGGLSAIGRALVGIGEDPANKAIRDARRQRELAREQAVLDMQARLPVEIEAATAKAALDNRIAQQNAQIQSQQLLQQAMAAGLLERTRAEGAQNLAMTQNIMQGIFG
jgi:hypothetical protein